MDLKTKILNGINKSLNESLNMDDFSEGDDLKILKKSLKQTILNSNIDNNKPYYQELMNLLFNTNIYLSALDLYLKYGIKFNPLQNGKSFYAIVYNSIKNNVCNLNWIDTSDVTSMEELFDLKWIEDIFEGEEAKVILSNIDKLDISNWDVSNVTNMRKLFIGIDSTSENGFNGDISKWDVSNVKDMSYMFAYSMFSGDISNWDVSHVTNMNHMFFNSEFDGDISDWEVSHVTDMHSMFEDSAFEGNISDWDVSHVNNMSYMFRGTNYDLDISNWILNNKCRVTSMLYDTEYDKEDFDNMIDKMVKNKHITEKQADDIVFLK